MRGIVDRTEGNFVICEINGPDGMQMKQIPLSLFSEAPKDGNVIELLEDRAVIQEEETAKRKKEMQSLFDRLKKES